MKLALLSLWASLTGAAVIEATDKDMETYLSKNIPTIVDLYASWCGHCKTFAPKFDELASEFEHLQDKIQFIKIDGDQNRQTSKRFDLQYFPTIRFVHGDRDEEIDDRDTKSLKKFIKENVGITPETEASTESSPLGESANAEPADAEPADAQPAKTQPKTSRESTESHIPQIIDDNFEETISGKHAFIAFTTTWCTYCKMLAPEWEKLAQIFSRDDDILIANADCTEQDLTYSLMHTFDIDAFPNIIYIPANVVDGNKPKRYDGPRTLEGLLKFAKDLGISHRSIDGKLDETAGLIPDLDLSVLPDYDALAAEVSKLSSKSADVYEKVISKAKADSSYLSRESKRLKKLLETSLKPAAADSFQIKANIIDSLLNAVGERKTEL